MNRDKLVGVNRRWKYEKGKGKRLPKTGQHDKFHLPFPAVKYPDNGQRLRNLDYAKKKSECRKSLPCPLAEKKLFYLPPGDPYGKYFYLSEVMSTARGRLTYRRLLSFFKVSRLKVDSPKAANTFCSVVNKIELAN